ncbi:MAG TPA: EAL domain-containing protein [Terriglobales bacterium]|jgi:EAL domain-containing protein (putative c-di-GMP-specific phosphodiesterase class I)|nr:EAL domain-containing protein [Terriglobales bacterium]
MRMKEPSGLNAILAPGGLTVRFQPVIALNSNGSGRPTLHALESLMRGPKGTNLETAGVLFEYVRLKHEENTVDRACVQTALEGASRLPGNFLISINIHASTLGRDPGFIPFLVSTAEEKGIPLSSLIIEIVEQKPFWEPSLQKALIRLREHSISIALDDVGLGYSNYRMMLDCKPDYFKIDSYVVRGSHEDPYRRAVLGSIAQLASKFNAQVVAEGVEDTLDMESVAEAGIGLTQGYLFAKPLTVEEFIASDWAHSCSSVHCAAPISLPAVS